MAQSEIASLSSQCLQGRDDKACARLIDLVIKVVKSSVEGVDVGTEFLSEGYRTPMKNLLALAHPLLPGFVERELARLAEQYGGIDKEEVRISRGLRSVRVSAYKFKDLTVEDTRYVLRHWLIQRLIPAIEAFFLRALGRDLYMRAYERRQRARSRVPSLEMEAPMADLARVEEVYREIYGEEAGVAAPPSPRRQPEARGPEAAAEEERERIERLRRLIQERLRQIEEMLSKEEYSPAYLAIRREAPSLAAAIATLMNEMARHCREKPAVVDLARRELPRMIDTVLKKWCS